METAEKMLAAPDIYLILTGVVMGTAARLFNLKVDFRQVPSFPSAYLNTIFLGFVASCLGAIAIPAILSKDFAAITFLTVAIQQFREVRKMEQESLRALEHSEYVQRGSAYIDGIAKTFESKNYISLITALVTVLAMKLAGSRGMAVSIGAGAGAGFAALYLCSWFTKGKTVDRICDIRPGQVQVRGAELYVNGIFVTNFLGSDRARKLFSEEGIAVVLAPRNQQARIALENHGQMQAMLFEATRTLGVKEYEFSKKDLASGNVVIAFVPVLREPDKLLRVVASTPILENSRKLKRLMKTKFGG